MAAPPTVRLADPELDAEAVAAVYAAAVLHSVATFEEVPPGADEMGERMRAVLDRTPWLVAERAGGGVVGYAYASTHRPRAGYRWSVDVSVYVSPDQQGRGVGRALYDRLFDLLRRQGFVNAYAGISLPNAPSIALHAAMGMEQIGIYRRIGYKFGRWLDVAWYGVRLAEPSEPPAEPIPISALPGA